MQRHVRQTFTWSEADQAHLDMAPDPHDIKEWMGSPAARHLRARVKQALLVNQEAFFRGSVGVPPGLTEASVREAYAVGLAEFGSMVLGLLDEMRQQGTAPDPQPETRERDPFDFSGANL